MWNDCKEYDQDHLLQLHLPALCQIYTLYAYMHNSVSCNRHKVRIVYFRNSFQLSRHGLIEQTQQETMKELVKCFRTANKQLKAPQLPNNILAYLC